MSDLIRRETYMNLVYWHVTFHTKNGGHFKRIGQQLDLILHIADYHYGSLIKSYAVEQWLHAENGEPVHMIEEMAEREAERWSLTTS